MSKSQQLIDTRNALFTTFTFWFHFFRSADKIDEDDAFVHLILPPPPCHVTARAILILGHSAYTELPLSPTHPAFLLSGAVAYYPRPAFLYTITVLDPVDIAALLCERVPACKDHVTVCRLCFATYSRFIILNWPYVLDKKIGKGGF